MSLWIAFGSALGGVLRYWCSGLVARWVGEIFPWGTIAVNVVGWLLITRVIAHARRPARCRHCGQAPVSGGGDAGQP